MSKVLLTGGNGFIGGYLAQKIKRELDFDVHNIALPGEQHKEFIDKQWPADLRDYEQVGAILRTAKPDFIIHLAARTEVEKSFYDPIEFSEVNYVGTTNLIEKSRDVKNLKLFIFASTMETYGWSPESDAIEENDHTAIIKPFTEDTTQHPNAPYAVAKVGCEYYLKYAGRAYKLPWTAFRQTNTYGRWDNDFFVVEQIITQMLKNPDTISLGYKEPYRNFIHIDDLVDLYITVLKNPEKANNEIFCTGPPNALSIASLANKVAQKIGWKGVIEWNKKPKRVGEIYYLNSTHAKAEEYLGWKPKIDLDTGLERTIEIWREKVQNSQ